MNHKIVPHLWFDKEAKEAADFYSFVFPNSSITSTSTLHDTPLGDCEVVSFTVCGHPFMSISAGPMFKFNPSISFLVNFDPAQMADAKTRIDDAWTELAHGGKVLMPIGKYPFSERYGWIVDKFGVSWQLILTNPAGEQRPIIIPSLLFVGDVCGKAEEATDLYISVFKDAQRGEIARYPAGMEPNKEGTVMFTNFMLEGQWFAAMDSAQQHSFAFNEAISFMVYCNDQSEIDYYWEKLSAVPAAEQCGWIKDQYGLSWQIVPTAMDKMLEDPDPERVARVTKAFLGMKKFDIAELQRAYDGE